ncbi:hypothetical protein BKA69DRAFT_314455 [Paraphysoderma sedebokerense]|nr:hypothetical protein BKA69DRAFT_314455 [Paraphysoderma sedebokerense]
MNIQNSLPSIDFTQLQPLHQRPAPFPINLNSITSANPEQNPSDGAPHPEQLDPNNQIIDFSQFHFHAHPEAFSQLHQQFQQNCNSLNLAVDENGNITATQARSNQPQQIQISPPDSINSSGNSSESSSAQAFLSAEDLKYWQATSRLRKRRWRQALPEERKELYNAKERERRAKSRMIETEEQKEQRRAKERERQRRRRQNLSDQQKALMKLQEGEKRRIVRSSETPEEAAQRRERDRERKRRSRAKQRAEKAMSEGSMAEGLDLTVDVS